MKIDSKQEALDVLGLLEKESVMLSDEKLDKCHSIAWQYGEDKEVAAQIKKLIASQLPHIKLDEVPQEDGSTYAERLGYLECLLHIAKDDAGESTGFYYPETAKIVSDYIRDQTFLKEKQKENPSSTFLAKSIKLFCDDDNNIWTEAIDEVYCRDKDKNYYYAGIGEYDHNCPYYDAMYRCCEEASIDDLVVAYDDKVVVLSYNKDEECYDVIDSSQEHDFEIINNNMYLCRGEDELSLFMKNHKTGQFEKQDLDLQNVRYFGSIQDCSDVLSARKCDENNNHSFTIWVKDKDGHLRKDAEYPAGEDTINSGNWKRGEDGRLSFETRTKKGRSYFDFRYTREKSGKSYLEREINGEGYVHVDKFYIRTDPLEDKLAEIRGRLKANHIGLIEADIGKTGNSCTGEVTEKHKHIAKIQTNIAKAIMLQQRKNKRM